MKILIIDNNIDLHSWGAKNLGRYAAQVPGSTVITRRGPSDDLPRTIRGFDRIVISGSRTSCLDHFPWVEKLEAQVKEAIDAGIPLLGVCYGHQVIARAVGGQEIVRKAAKSEFGWTKIEQTNTSPLLAGLPKIFYSFSSHFEEVSRLAPGFRHLAKSPDCDIQAVQLEGKPVYGIQFHPEKNLNEAQEILDERVKKGGASTLLSPHDSKKLYNPDVGARIFENFFKLEKA
jgi:GMP synthase (glutamine-hydrolysing)